MSMTPAERVRLAAAIGCEFHGPEYGECAACASHAEQVWDDAISDIIAERDAATSQRRADAIRQAMKASDQ